LHIDSLECDPNIMTC